MKEILMKAAGEMVQDQKVAKAVVGSGAAISTGTILEWLPAVVGIVASVMTIIFSLFLLYFHWKKMKRDEEKHRIDMAILKTRRSSDYSESR